MTAFPEAAVDRLPFAGEEAADRFLVANPIALLIGFVLDQQVPMERAFSAPLELSRRLGGITPRQLLTGDPKVVEAAFTGPPALHRFPNMMARRVLSLCRVLDENYGDYPERLWTEVRDARELVGRLRDLPGIGAMKAETMLGVFARQLGVRPVGWESLLPDHPCLGEVRDRAGLTEYRAWKRRLKEAGAA